jgi:hypothetical protein
LEAIHTWKTTKYLSLKADRQRIGSGHTGMAASIWTDPPCFFFTIVTGVQKKKQKENGMLSPQWEVSLTWGHLEKRESLR